MSQESDISSIDPHETPVEQGSVEETQGEADSNNAAFEPEPPETVQPPVSTAAQTPATTTTSNLPQTAPTTATTATTQSVAITTTTGNIHTTIAIIHQASTPENEATPATPVPGRTDPSPEELAADEGSGISPQQDLKTAIEDHYVSHSMSGLQLGDKSIPETDPKPDNVTSGGPGPLSDSQKPSTQLPMSRTPNKPLPELQDGSNVSATASSEQLGSTIHAAHDSTTSVSGFESASDIFHGDTSSNVPDAQQTGSNMSESVTDSDMVQDPAHEENVDMDTTHQNAYTQHDDGNPPVAKPGPSNQPSMGTDQTMQLVAQLLQAQQAGNLADVTDQLHGPQAEQLVQLLQLAKAVANPASAERGHPPA